MRAHIGLYQRPKHGTARLPIDVNAIAVGYQRMTKAVGGYFSGSFDIPGSRVQPNELREFFDTWLGCVFKEHTAGIVTWEGMVYAMNLVQGGAEYHISLESDWFHNNVEVVYSNAAVVDTHQGNLSYTDESGDDTFTDDGQDFTAWQTTSGDAAYRIQVANTDGTVSWSYLGAIVAATEIYVYQDTGLTTSGWNDQDPSGLTPETYEVIQVSLENSRSTTGLSADSNSQSEYGDMEYIVSLAGASSAAATALRARHITEFSWPRSRFINTGPSEDILVVALAGFWYTTFWRHRRSSETGEASTLISNLVGDTEFVTAGRISDNTLEVTADAYPISQRIGDLIERTTAHGDASGNAWRCGVYANKKLHYEQAPTSAEFFVRDGRLLDKTGQLVMPEFIEPGILVRAHSMSRITPPGSAAWGESDTTYVDQVEYTRDDRSVRLSLSGEPFSVITLSKQIVGGAAQ